ncbi:DUF4871 domain-containing protein [Bacillus testis]|uniref:DUF4871 domain-containing protein n=1 Tax=Bacillus testis TaxID=1622072 RepID=UPI00067E9895|nr:DUF4871 domain-containing protein [Bacillus testis]
MRLGILYLSLFSLFIIAGCTSDPATSKEDQWKDNSPAFSSDFGNMFGKDGRIGIIGSKKIPKEGQKWMWHFWGTEEITTKHWKVKATKQGAKDEINPIIQKDDVLTARGKDINGHARSAVKFPSSGLWKLQVFIDGHFFDEMIVDIEQQ